MFVKAQIDCDCIEASNGKQALQIARQENIDLVIMDVEMPLMNGRDTFLHLRESKPHLKIIVLTYLLSDETLLYFVHHNANGFLQKDPEPLEIFQAISSVLKGKKHFPEKIIEAVHAKLPKILREVEKLDLTPREIQIDQEDSKRQDQ